MLIQKQAPGFDIQACMPDDSFKNVKLSDYEVKSNDRIINADQQVGSQGKYVVLYFYPADFTFVCASETIGFHNAMSEFSGRNCVVLGASCDTAHVHKAWKNTEKKLGGLGTNINHPIIADTNKDLARAYDVLLEEEGVAVRGVFIIGKDGRVRAEMKNDLPLGRNVDEVIRVLDSIIETDEHGVVCPANWEKGKDTMIPSTDGVADYLMKHT